MRAACAAAAVKRVLTSRRFVAQGRLEELVEDLAEHSAISYLEDVRQEIGAADKAFAAIAGAFPRRFRARAAPEDVGVILFTSGSFGAPKGVVLSHANILSNIAQVSAHIALGRNWRCSTPCPRSTASA